MPLDESKEKTEMVPYEETNSKAEEKERDLKFARDNLYGLIEHGASSLEELKQVAEQSQHPRAYEVLSTMIKTLLDANKDLIDVSEKKNKEAVEEKQQERVQNNNLFVGSTADLLNMLDRDKDKDDNSNK